MQEPSLNILGPFPILQLCAGIVILGVCAYAWMRGQRQGVPEDQQQQPQITWRFDGPIAIALKRLEESATSSSRMENLLNNVAEETRNQSRLMTEIRDTLNRGNQLLDRLSRREQ